MAAGSTPSPAHRAADSLWLPPEERMHFLEVSASGNAKLHAGHHYNPITNTVLNTFHSRPSSEDGRTLDENLLKAAREGQAARVSSLLNRGADVDHADEKGMTALHHAALSGWERCVQILLEQGADVNAESRHCGTPLCIAVALDSIRVVKLLLDHNAAVGAPGGCFGSALHAACFSKSKDVVDLVLHASKSVNLEREVRLEECSAYGAAWEWYVPTRVRLDLVFTCQPLILAIGAAREEVVVALLERDADVEADLHLTGQFLEGSKSTYARHHRALTLAARADRGRALPDSTYGAAVSGILLLLLRRRPDIDRLTDGKDNALIITASNDFDDRMCALLDAGASMKLPPGTEGTICGIAVKYAAKDCLRELLRRGAAPDETDHHGMTALHLAAREGDVKCLRLLLDAGSNVQATEEDGWQPLHFAARFGKHDCMERLIEAGSDVRATDNFGWEPLHRAAFHGHSTAISTCIQHGSALNATTAKGETPLMLAAEKDHLDAVQYLMQLKADIHVASLKGWQVLHKAACYARPEMALSLIQEGVDIESRVEDKYNETALIIAADKERGDTVRALLANNANVHAASSLGLQSIHFAATRGLPEMASSLLEAGADVNATTNQCLTPLHLAAKKGHLELVQLLVTAGASMNAFSDTDPGMTPLHYACREGHLTVATYLIEKGAEIDSRAAKTFETPLIIAARKGHLDLVRMLLTSGADASWRNSKAKTALKMAQSESHNEVVELLKEHMKEQQQDKPTAPEAGLSPARTVDKKPSQKENKEKRSPRRHLPRT